MDHCALKAFLMRLNNDGVKLCGVGGYQEACICNPRVVLLLSN